MVNRGAKIYFGGPVFESCSGIWLAFQVMSRSELCQINDTVE